MNPLKSLFKKNQMSVMFKFEPRIQVFVLESHGSQIHIFSPNEFYIIEKYWWTLQNTENFGSRIGSFTDYSYSRFSFCCRVCLGLESPQDQLSPENALKTQIFLISSQMWAVDTLTFLVPFQDKIRHIWKGFQTSFPFSLPLHIDFTLR